MYPGIDEVDRNMSTGHQSRRNVCSKKPCLVDVSKAGKKYSHYSGLFFVYRKFAQIKSAEDHACYKNILFCVHN